MEFLANVVIDGKLYNYHVTKDGRVFSLNYRKTGKTKEMEYCLTEGGYRCVNLCKDGRVKYVQVSRLVALVYIENPENKPTVDHINRNKVDDRVENLRWATYSEQTNNRKELPKNNKKSKPVRCVETGEVFPSMREVERQKGYSNQSICKCCNGKHKTAYGFHWQYV